jgi:large subunit ribosomal protein L24
MHVKTGDEVLIITGKDKGKRGKIREAMPKENRVIVEGLNIIKRHTKARGPGKPGGIIEMEAPLQVSNVMLICPKGNHAARTGVRLLEETDHKGRARKVRFCKVCGEVVDE